MQKTNKMACLHPIIIKNKTGFHKVSCGRCPACMNVKASRYSQLCNIESQKHKYNFFVTLTYDDDHLPTASCNPISWNDVGQIEEILFLNETERIDKYEGNVIDIVYADYDYCKTANIYLPFQHGKYTLTDNKFGYLYKKDCIDFLKRLRYNIYRKNYKKKLKEYGEIRYFLCGEYGPRHFRPHYHLSVYFNSEEICRKFFESVCSSWKMGRIDCQLSTTGRSNGYVSKYINSASCLPSFYQQKEFRPFVLHSRYFGISPNEPYYQEIENLRYDKITEREFNLTGRIVRDITPLSLQAALFPKCYGFGLADHDCNLLRYRIYPILSSFLAKEKVSEIVSYCKEHNYVLEDFRYNISDLFFGSDNLESTLTTALYISKKVQKLSSIFNCSIYYYYTNVIRRYYEDQDTNNLKKFYQDMVDDTASNLCLPVELIDRYGNIPRMPYRDYLYYKDSDDDVLFALKRIADFSEQVHVMPSVVCQVNYDYEHISGYEYNYQLQCKIASDNIKHKVQNDINKKLYV